MPEFTPTEQTLMNILRDGLAHTRHELRDAMDGEFTSWPSLRMMISNIRKKVRSQGLEVICEYRRRKTHYRLVRLITMDE